MHEREKKGNICVCEKEVEGKKRNRAFRLAKTAYFSSGISAAD